MRDREQTNSADVRIKGWLNIYINVRKSLRVLNLAERNCWFDLMLLSWRLLLLLLQFLLKSLFSRTVPLPLSLSRGFMQLLTFHSQLWELGAAWGDRSEKDSATELSMCDTVELSQQLTIIIFLSSIYKSWCAWDTNFYFFNFCTCKFVPTARLKFMQTWMICLHTTLACNSRRPSPTKRICSNVHYILCSDWFYTSTLR